MQVNKSSLIKTMCIAVTALLVSGGSSWANQYSYLPPHTVVVDAKITGTELTEANNGRIKVVEYNRADINFNYAFDTNSHTFTAPESGLYNIDARYSQRACGYNYLLRIGISLPNAAAPGGNNAIGPVTFADIANYGCAIPGIAAVSSIMTLEKGDTIFIQARYQRAPYSISAWNYNDEYQNRLLITYLGGLTF